MLRRSFLKFASAAVLLPALRWAIPTLPDVVWETEHQRFRQLVEEYRERMYAIISEGMEKRLWGPA